MRSRDAFGDEYWGMSALIGDMNELFRKAGCRVPKKAFKGQNLNFDFTGLARRIVCQLPIYNKCTTEELHKFAVDRMLIRSKKAVSRDRLIRLLEVADKKRTFTRFMELSPEVRCEVYGWYLASFPERLRHPYQPPLSKTCRIVRTELLPLFYQTTQFELSMYNVIDSRRHELPFETYSLQFLKKLSAADLGDICKLHWTVTFNYYGRDGGRQEEYTWVEVEIDLKAGEKTLIVREYPDEEFYGLDDPEIFSKKVTEAIDGCFSIFVKNHRSDEKNKARKKLTLQDFYDTQKSIEKTAFGLVRMQKNYDNEFTRPWRPYP